MSVCVRASSPMLHSTFTRCTQSILNVVSPSIPHPPALAFACILPHLALAFACIQIFFLMGVVMLIGVQHAVKFFFTGNKVKASSIYFGGIAWLL